MTGLSDGVARTSGGKWDPEHENIAFLAGTVEDARVAQNPFTLLAINEISTKKQVDQLDQWCDERTVLLDSGVYNLAAAHARNNDISLPDAFNLPPEDMDGWDELYDKWCGLASRFGDRLWGMIELDQGGKDAVRETRKRAIADSGIIPIPVYHPMSDGWGYYDELAQSHDRISCGGLTGSPGSRLRLCWTVSDRARRYPYLWTHLLGITPMPWVLSLGWRGSCDSSAWLSPVRWATSWRAWSMLQRISGMPTAMTYDRGTDKEGATGYNKAKRQAAVSAHFQQVTLAALADDTHPNTR